MEKIESYTKIVPLLGTFLLFCGILDKFIYYHLFGVPILSILDLSEIAGLFFEDILQIILFLLVGLVMYVMWPVMNGFYDRLGKSLIDRLNNSTSRLEKKNIKQLNRLIELAIEVDGNEEELDKKIRDLIENKDHKGKHKKILKLKKLKEELLEYRSELKELEEEHRKSQGQNGTRKVKNNQNYTVKKTSRAEKFFFTFKSKPIIIISFSFVFAGIFTALVSFKDQHILGLYSSLIIIAFSFPVFLFESFFRTKFINNLLKNVPNEEQKAEKTKLRKGYFFSLFAFSFFCLSAMMPFQRASEILEKERSFPMVIKFKDRNVETNSEFKFIGNTKDYIFFFDMQNNRTVMQKMANVEEINFSKELNWPE